MKPSIAVFILCFMCCQLVCAKSLDFVALGDIPYNEAERAMLTPPDGKLAAAIKRYSPKVVVHYGDFKPGDLDCSDEVFLQRRALLANLYPNRVVYTPGDNEWTDCDKESVPNRVDELERLKRLRTLFFTGEGLKLSSGIDGLQRQQAAPENALWSIDGVLFGTIHVPGTNNGRDSISRSDVAQALIEASHRDQTNKSWLKKMFLQAEHSKALVLTFQADMFRPISPDKEAVCDNNNPTECDGYRSTREFIEYGAANLSIPVLLIHGDTNEFCFHRHKTALTSNLWRLNGPGDYSVIDAVKISVNPSDRKMPFVVKTLLGDKTPPQVCVYD